MPYVKNPTPMNFSNLLSGSSRAPYDDLGNLVEVGDLCSFPGLAGKYVVTSAPKHVGNGMWECDIDVAGVACTGRWDDNHKCRVYVKAHDPSVIGKAKPKVPGNIDEASYLAGAAAMRTLLMEQKYDALKDGRLDLERFDIRTAEVKWPP